MYRKYVLIPCVLLLLSNIASATNSMNNGPAITLNPTQYMHNSPTLVLTTKKRPQHHKYARITKIKHNKTQSQNLLDQEVVDPYLFKQFSIEVYRSTQLKNIIIFIAKYLIQNKAIFYKTRLKNRNEYIVIYGRYPTAATALHALHKLPKYLKTPEIKIKSLATVSSELHA